MRCHDLDKVTMELKFQMKVGYLRVDDLGGRWVWIGAPRPQPM